MSYLNYSKQYNMSCKSSFIIMAWMTSYLKLIDGKMKRKKNILMSSLKRMAMEADNPNVYHMENNFTKDKYLFLKIHMKYVG